MASARNIFIHHVFFWLQEPDNKGALDQLIAGLRRLSGAEIIRECHIGKPANTYRDVVERSYSVSWMVVFDTAADQDRYQKDPMHLRFIEECSHLWRRVVVYDSVNA